MSSWNQHDGDGSCESRRIRLNAGNPPFTNASRMRSFMRSSRDIDGRIDQGHGDDPRAPRLTLASEERHHALPDCSHPGRRERQRQQQTSSGPKRSEPRLMGMSHPSIHQDCVERVDGNIGSVSMTNVDPFGRSARFLRAVSASASSISTAVTVPREPTACAMTAE